MGGGRVLLAAELSERFARDLAPLCYGLSFFIVVNACVAAEDRLAGRPIITALTGVGVFSYSLYLIYYPTIMALRALLSFIARPVTMGVALIGMTVKIVVSVAVAAIFFQLVERRFLDRPARASVARHAGATVRVPR